ncbi:hypothetical protein BaRGS_00024984 [Batillaria attramentaria]|uniref:Uncharacterized protein n=1 Tax=Batillaria attramentaria TaxID=370345 RepID=A0ABD0K9L1_9CAEN
MKRQSKVAHMDFHLSPNQAGQVQAGANGKKQKISVREIEEQLPSHQLMKSMLGARVDERNSLLRRHSLLRPRVSALSVPDSYNQLSTTNTGFMRKHSSSLRPVVDSVLSTKTLSRSAGDQQLPKESLKKQLESLSAQDRFCVLQTVRQIPSSIRVKRQIL